MVTKSYCQCQLHDETSCEIKLDEACVRTQKQLQQPNSSFRWVRITEMFVVSIEKNKRINTRGTPYFCVRLSVPLRHLEELEERDMSSGSVYVWLIVPVRRPSAMLSSR